MFKITIKNILWAALYLIMGAVSCWATEESLSLLLPEGWPTWAVWAITLALFIFCSLGSYLLIEGLSSRLGIANQKIKTVGGILITVFVWLCFAMPTNVHTFFFRYNINKIINADVATTNKYLNQLVKDSTQTNTTVDVRDTRVFNKVDSVRQQINDLKEKLRVEFNGEGPTGKRGNGEQVGKYLLQIANLLGTNKLTPDSRYNSTDVSILNKYNYEIDNALTDYLKRNSYTIPEDVSKKAEKQIRSLTLQKETIYKFDKEKIKDVDNELVKAYNLIRQNKDFINFDNIEDNNKYTSEDTKTSVNRAKSVIDVFYNDFLGGKYSSDFLWFVLFAILIDVMAFVFFNLGFEIKL